MSGKSLSFNYITIEEFIRSGFTEVPEYFHIVPVFHVLDTKDIYAMLCLNETLTVTDFGGKLSRRKTIVSFICDNIARHSLDTIVLSESRVLEKSMVAFATTEDVSTGFVNIDPNYSVIIFVDIDIDNQKLLNDIVKQYKSKMKTLMSVRSKPDTEIVAMTFMDCTSMYYLLRFTTWRTIDQSTGEELTLSVKDNGFPALDVITRIYRADYSNGEVPYTENPNIYTNTCPEISFYNKVNQNLANAFVAYINHGLNIML